MNFADKIKIDLNGISNRTEETSTAKEMQEMLLSQPEEVSFMAQTDPEALKKLIPRKELTALDVAKAAIQLINVTEETLGRKFPEDTEPVVLVLQKFVETMIGMLFGCKIKLTRIEEKDDE